MNQVVEGNKHRNQILEELPLGALECEPLHESSLAGARLAQDEQATVFLYSIEAIDTLFMYPREPVHRIPRRRYRLHQFVFR